MSPLLAAWATCRHRGSAMTDLREPASNVETEWPDDADDLLRRHRESLFPSVGLFYDEPIELRRGERQYVYDGVGHQYLDFFGGIATVSSGHALPEINEPIKEQLDRIIHSSTLSPLHVHYVGNPYCYRCPWEKTYPECDLLCARDVEVVIRTTTSGQPAAFIAEPVQGVGGFITPPPEYFVRVKEILDRYGIPFIRDEVQTAWGRIGVADWGFQAYGVEPDVVVFAKGLANGVPIGGVIATDALAGAIRSLSLSTFGGNPVATTAAMANLNYIATHNLRENARQVGEYLMVRLRELAERHPVIGDVRGMGLMVAVELVRDRATKEPAPDVLGRVQNEAKQRGLIIGRGGLRPNVIRICPPLIVSERDVDDAIRILDEAFAIATAA